MSMLWDAVSREPLPETKPDENRSSLSKFCRVADLHVYVAIDD